MYVIDIVLFMSNKTANSSSSESPCLYYNTVFRHLNQCLNIPMWQGTQSHKIWVTPSVFNRHPRGSITFVMVPGDDAIFTLLPRGPNGYNHYLPVFPRDYDSGQKDN